VLTSLDTGSRGRLTARDAATSIRAAVNMEDGAGDLCPAGSAHAVRTCTVVAGRDAAAAGTGWLVPERAGLHAIVSP
jgi:hypothetical protein